MDERRHDPVLPGFKEMAARRRALAGELLARRVSSGLTQTEVAARMGTSQSAVARLEAGDADVRLSTIERYVAAIGQLIEWRLADSPGRDAARGAPPAGAPTGRGPRGTPPARRPRAEGRAGRR